MIHDVLKIINILFAALIIISEVRACIIQRRLITHTLPIIIWLACQIVYYTATFLTKMDRVTANAFGSGLRLQGLLVIFFIRFRVYKR